MKPKTATHHRRWVLRLFEWSLLVIILQLLTGFFLQRVERLQASAEGLAFQGVVNSLKAGATFASINKDAQGMVLRGGNPMQLLEQVPANYVGELSQSEPKGSREGNWYFDSSQGLLIYFTREYRRTLSPLGKERRKLFRLDWALPTGKAGGQWVLVAVEI